jgi:hypothetical protein
VSRRRTRFFEVKVVGQYNYFLLGAAEKFESNTKGSKHIIIYLSLELCINRLCRRAVRSTRLIWPFKMKLACVQACAFSPMTVGRLYHGTRCDERATRQS